MSDAQIIQQPDTSDHVRLRARVLDELLDLERWSSRKAAIALGLTHTYVGARRSGKIDLSFSDIEAFAGLLKMTPVELFALLEEGPKEPTTD